MGKNLFFENGGLSEIAKKYMMGLIKYGREIQLVLNQWINSYKGLVPGFEAPVYIAWGTRNRSAYIRVPEVPKGKEKSTRIEIRSPDPTCNIYLALAAIQAAGIQGIKENLKLVPPQERNIYKMTREEMKRAKIVTLAKDLKEALENFQKEQINERNLGRSYFSKTHSEQRNRMAKIQKGSRQKVSEGSKSLRN